MRAAKHSLLCTNNNPIEQMDSQGRWENSGIFSSRCACCKLWFTLRWTGMLNLFFDRKIKTRATEQKDRQGWGGARRRPAGTEKGRWGGMCQPENSPFNSAAFSFIYIAAFSRTPLTKCFFIVFCFVFFTPKRWVFYFANRLFSISWAQTLHTNQFSESGFHFI